MPDTQPPQEGFVPIQPGPVEMNIVFEPLIGRETYIDEVTKEPKTEDVKFILMQIFTREGLSTYFIPEHAFRTSFLNDAKEALRQSTYGNLEIVEKPGIIIPGPGEMPAQNGDKQ